MRRNKGVKVLMFATQPYGKKLSLFEVAAKRPDEGIGLYLSSNNIYREGYRLFKTHNLMESHFDDRPPIIRSLIVHQLNHHMNDQS